MREFRPLFSIYSLPKLIDIVSINCRIRRGNIEEMI